jgi:hypothetical protein
MDVLASRAAARADSVGIRRGEELGRVVRRTERIVELEWQRTRCVWGGSVERSVASGIGARRAVIVDGAAG